MSSSRSHCCCCCSQRRHQRQQQSQSLVVCGGCNNFFSSYFHDFFLAASAPSHIHCGSATVAFPFPITQTFSRLSLCASSHFFLYSAISIDFFVWLCAPLTAAPPPSLFHNSRFAYIMFNCNYRVCLCVCVSAICSSLSRVRRSS